MNPFLRAAGMLECARRIAAEFLKHDGKLSAKEQYAVVAAGIDVESFPVLPSDLKGIDRDCAYYNLGAGHNNSTTKGGTP